MDFGEPNTSGGRPTSQRVGRIGAEGVIRHLRDQDGGSRSALYGTLHGVVFDILVGSEHRAGPVAVFPDDDRRMTCRAAKRRAQMLSRMPLGTGEAGAERPGRRVGRTGAEGVIRHLGDQDGGSRSALRTDF
jgi:hypothetical protein